MEIECSEDYVSENLLEAISRARLERDGVCNIKFKLIRQMCDVARNGVDIDSECRLRYILSNKKWHRFEPGIFEMRSFGEIIDRNFSGITRDTQQKTDYYLRTIAIAFMKEYYDCCWNLV